MHFSNISVEKAGAVATECTSSCGRGERFPFSFKENRKQKSQCVPSAVVTTRTLRVRGLLRLHDYADYAKWHDEGPSGQPSIETRLAQLHVTERHPILQCE